MPSSKSKRVRRVEKVLAALPVSPIVLRQAFEDFRETGDLPQARAVAKAVIVWAETGVDPCPYGDDPLDRQALLRAYLHVSWSEQDRFMNQLREEAVFADDPVRSIARIVLQTLAMDGCDPSQPLFVQGRIPKLEMTCPYVSLSMVQFPFGLVAEADHPRVALLLERFRSVRELLDQKDDAEVSLWFKRLEEACEMLAAGETVADPLMHEALVATAELRELILASGKPTGPVRSPDQGAPP
jgi:hypothetical protein